MKKLLVLLIIGGFAGCIKEPRPAQAEAVWQLVEMLEKVPPNDWTDCGNEGEICTRINGYKIRVSYNGSLYIEEREMPDYYISRLKMLYRRITVDEKIKNVLGLNVEQRQTK